MLSASSDLQYLAEPWFLNLHVFKDFIHLFLERGEGGQKKRQRNIQQLPLTLLQQGPCPKPRHVPWAGIQMTSFQFAGKRPTQWATPVRDRLIFIEWMKEGGGLGSHKLSCYYGKYTNFNICNIYEYMLTCGGLGSHKLSCYYGKYTNFNICNIYEYMLICCYIIIAFPHIEGTEMCKTISLTKRGGSDWICMCFSYFCWYLLTECLLDSRLIKQCTIGN